MVNLLHTTHCKNKTVKSVINGFIFLSHFTNRFQRSFSMCQAFGAVQQTSG